MKRSYLQSLSFIRFLMVILNTIIVISYSSIFLLTTKYIIEHQLSREFLDTIVFIPHRILWSFFGSILLFGGLVYIMYHRSKKTNDNKVGNIFYNILEVVLCFTIIYLLYMGYNGLVLLVFCDCIYHLKDDKSSKWLLGILVIVYLLANYDVFSVGIPLTNPQAYFEVYQQSVKGLLLIGKNILETLNIILFILFMIVYIAEQMQVNENISKELNMINQVNKELQNYAAITEKIGENNERKRLAREIHDTLGHALTGIAAGVDACIAMIDGNPKDTKKQLFVVSKVVRQGIGDVRNSLNKLRPGALEEHGLKGAIEKMIEEFTSVSELKIVFNYQLNKIDFENTKEDILFRIIQESITNAMRHSGATKIYISIYQEDHNVYLKIQDHGVGCDEIHYGFGLKQMQERVVMVNGKIELDGRDGFSITVCLPIERGEIYD